jgi:tripartite-type tricarboxylate transporter receptor subunit TctC
VRAEGLPDGPTFPEVGIADFASYGWIAMLAPARTPPAVAEKLNAAVNDILDLPDVKARLGTLGFGPNRQSLPDTGKRLDAEIANWSRMVGAIGLKIK